MTENLASAAEALRHAGALLITAGAGLGVDSGFPDFRGTTGFWNAYPPYAKLGIEFAELACPDTLEEDPALFWGFYEHRRQLYRDTVPHAGYEILRKFALSRSAFVFTSNVDGHFLRAGFSDAQVFECHGSIHHLQCSEPCGDDLWSAQDIALAIDSATMHAVGTFPSCRRCGKTARPNVLMFGDGAWVGSRAAAQRVNYENWRDSIRGKRLVVLELGAGTALPTVRWEGEAVAARNQGTLIRVNPREYAVDGCGGISLPGTALATLEMLVNTVSNTVLAPDSNY